MFKILHIISACFERIKSFFKKVESRRVIFYKLFFFLFIIAKGCTPT
ncbi:hypothetical protein SAMN04489841_1128 [Natrinema salaciae]|uniref:Uncharacterized protein n=1 Tax=Natrinema salaciae TaxID=1186196 RepID=A0A1H9CQN8_9EURY|nr:hypothetical protein SAMN04489841_1128 [Natrinema salaciae]